MGASKRQWVTVASAVAAARHLVDRRTINLASIFFNLTINSIAWTKLSQYFFFALGIKHKFSIFCRLVRCYCVIKSIASFTNKNNNSSFQSSQNETISTGCESKLYVHLYSYCHKLNEKFLLLAKISLKIMVVYWSSLL